AARGAAAAGARAEATRRAGAGARGAMRIWRLGAAAALLALVGLPLLLPFGELLARPGAWGAWRELDRLLPLARNTALLTAGTLLVTIPVGVPVAVFLYRSNLPARAALRAALLLGLF